MSNLFLNLKLELRKVLPSSVLIKHQYKRTFGRKLDLHNPETFNEKLQWLKLYNRNPKFTKMVDKYEVKKYVADIIGEDYVIPTIGIWDCYEQIDIGGLPDKFVLKTTHDSGSYFICENKSNFDFSEAKIGIKRALKHNFYFDGREWPYKNVKPRIIAEEFIGYYPLDYKFFVFGGEIDSVMVCKGRELGHPYFYFYDMNWNRLYYQHDNLEKEDQIGKPKDFDRMIEIVKKLSEGLCHIRVDLYNVNGKIYFGEYTFFDQGGLDTDITYETDKMWGKKIKLEKYGK